MAEVIETAGRAGPVAPFSVRKEAIKAVRAILKNPSATDAEVEDALETLVELSKD